MESTITAVKDLGLQPEEILQELGSIFSVFLSDVVLLDTLLLI